MTELADVLASLPSGALEALVHGFAGRSLSIRSSPEKLASTLGVALPQAQQVATALERVFSVASDEAISVALPLAAETALQVSRRAGRVSEAIDLVLSGPRVGTETMRDTASVFASLIREARLEVLVTGYVAIKATNILTPLAEFLDADDSRRAMIVLDFKRENDTSLTQELALRKANEFWAEQWPRSRRRPELLYDTRSLVMDRKLRTSMHAKVLVIDRTVLFVTSANLTQRAHSENIELGVVVRAEHVARTVATYFDSLRSSGCLARPSPLDTD